MLRKGSLIGKALVSKTKIKGSSPFLSVFIYLEKLAQFGRVYRLQR